MNQIKSIISKIDDKDILRIYEIGDEFNHHHKIIYQTELEEDELHMFMKCKYYNRANVNKCILK